MGSNLKKGLYMRFKVSKKKFVLLISLFILFIVLLIGGLYLLFNGEEFRVPTEESFSQDYVRLLEFCSTHASSREEGVVECQVLLEGNYSFDSEGNFCTEILFPDPLENGGSEMYICLREDFVEWDNPYEGLTEYYIPVSFSIVQTGFLAHEQIIIEWLEDEKASPLFESIDIFHFSDKPFLFKSNAKVINQGFHIPVEGVINMRDFLLEDFESSEGEIILYGKVRIYGEDIKIMFASEEVEYFEIGPDSSLTVPKPEATLDPENFSEKLEKSREYQLFFNFEGDETEVDTYLKSLDGEDYITLEGFDLKSIHYITGN